MRTNAELLQIPAAQWTEAEAMRHLTETFDIACRAHPEIMEPWIVMFPDVVNPAELKTLMRQALSATIAARYPHKLL